MNPPLVLGNWKMNGGPKASLELVRKISNQLRKRPTLSRSRRRAAFHGAFSGKESR